MENATLAPSPSATARRAVRLGIRAALKEREVFVCEIHGVIEEGDPETCGRGCDGGQEWHAGDLETAIDELPTHELRAAARHARQLVREWRKRSWRRSEGDLRIERLREDARALRGHIANVRGCLDSLHNATHWRNECAKAARWQIKQSREALAAPTLAALKASVAKAQQRLAGQPRPTCAHSACAQNWIENGDTACVKGSTEVIRG